MHQVCKEPNIQTFLNNVKQKLNEFLAAHKWNKLICIVLYMHRLTHVDAASWTSTTSGCSGYGANWITSTSLLGTWDNPCYYFVSAGVYCKPIITVFSCTTNDD